MAAIDFKKLMLEERRRAREERLGGESARPVDSHSPASNARAKPCVDVLYTLPLRAGRPAFDAATHRVPCEVDGVHHVAEWCTASEEEDMIACIDRAPASQWTQLRGRKLQSLGGVPRPPPEMMSREPLPAWVQSVCDELVRAGLFPANAPPNHVLLNSYTPGQGIDAHKDGPLYAPRVVILSLGSHCAFEFVEDDLKRGACASLLLPRRGLLVFEGDAYERVLHRVPALSADDLSAPGLIRLDCDGTVATCAGGDEVDAAKVRAGQRPPTAHLAPRSRRLSLTVRRVIHSRPAVPSADDVDETLPCPRVRLAALSRGEGDQ
jgi:alkylated DNA repair protein alkB family protein 6